MLDELKFHLVRAQEKMKMVADKHRRDIQFEVGDLVYIKLRPYHLRTLARKPNEKLGPKYFGPFEVIKLIGPMAYRLQLPLLQPYTLGSTCPNLRKHWEPKRLVN